jgi:ATP-dependent DNA helicase DinG
MRGILVAIDTETTGLNASDDHMIEIGAAKFLDGEMIATYTVLIDPGISIPPRVTEITHITDKMVQGAPKVADVLPDLVRFVGDAPLVGHNIDFDLRFIRKQKVLQENQAIDTYEMAAVLVPSASRYNLNALMQHFNIAVEGEYHRALTDAIADGRLYYALWQKMLTALPFGVLSDIARLAEAQETKSKQFWRARLPFEAALAARAVNEKGNQTDPVRAAFTARPAAKQVGPALAAPAEPFRLDLNALMVKLAFALPESARDDVTAYQYQADLTREIGAAFNAGKKMIMDVATDAATYLLPAAQYALGNGQPVVICVGTEAAHRDLYETALPALRAALGADGDSLRVVSLRRRSEMICPAQVAAMRHYQPTSNDELRLLAKTMLWLTDTANDPYAPPFNEANRLSYRGPGEYAAWAQLNAERCAFARCQAEKADCPAAVLRGQAANAHLIFADRGALISDASSAEPILPAYAHLIIDGAEHLEDAVTESLHFRLDPTRVRRELLTLGTSQSGLLGSVLTMCQPVVPEKTYSQLAEGIESVAAAAGEMHVRIGRLFKAIKTFAESATEARPNDFSVSVIISANLRAKPTFGAVLAEWEPLSEFMQTVVGVLPQLVKRLGTLQGKYALPEADSLKGSLNRMIARFEAFYQQLHSLLITPDSNRLYWAELSAPSERAEPVTVHLAPLNAGKVLAQYLWSQCQTAVVLGRALTYDGHYGYSAQALGVGNFDAIELDTPPANAGLQIYLPTDIPEPTEKDRYNRAIEKAVIDVVTALRAAGQSGKTVVLFPSQTALRGAAQTLSARLALGGINVFDQSDGSSQSALSAGLRAAENGVLLGVRGHWDDYAFEAEGVSSLIVVRLPFPNLSDPLIVARNDTHANAFNDYTLPLTASRLRTSLERFGGRRGQRFLAILDKRMTAKGYGNDILDNLPRGEVLRGKVEELGTAAKNWLSK